MLRLLPPFSAKNPSVDVLIFLPNLIHGGAESVLVRIANALADDGLSVALVLATAEGELLRSCSDKVTLIDLGCERLITSSLPLSSVLKRLKPSIVFSSIREANLILVFSTFLSGSKSKIILRQANTMSRQIQAESGLYGLFKSICVFLSYRFADKIVLQSSEIATDLCMSGYTPTPRQLEILPNPLDICRINTLSQAPLTASDLPFLSKTPLILCLGRLHEQKNYPFLIQALHQYRQNSDFKLLIIGEGRLRPSIQQLILSLGLTDFCHLVGYRANPYPLLSKADVFVLPSHFEGMSNSLLEAMALGVKVLVSSSQSTSCRLVKDYGFGHIYQHDDVNDFCHKLDLTLRLDQRLRPTQTEVKDESMTRLLKLFRETLNQP